MSTSWILVVGWRLLAACLTGLKALKSGELPTIRYMMLINLVIVLI